VSRARVRAKIRANTKAEAGAETEPEAKAKTEADARAKAIDTVPPSRLVVYSAAGLVGAFFFHLELVWYRMLSPILGGSSFTFGLILAVVLAGIGTGGWIYAGRFTGRTPALGDLAVTVALEALAVGVPFGLGDRIALFAAYTRPMGALGFFALVVSWTVVCALVVFPAALISGYQFPLLIALLGRGREHVASHVGRASAYNTIGCIAGSLAGVFLIIPGLGAVQAWRLCVLGLTGLSAAILLLDFRSRGRAWTKRGLSAGIAVLAAFCGAAEGPTAAWRHSAIGVGTAKIAQLDAIGLKNWIKRSNDLLVWERDGVESSVGVVASNGYSVFINGKSDGSTSGDRGTQTMAGVLPALLHPDPKSAFVLGLGTGMTAGWLARLPGMDRVDVAELEPAVLEVARTAFRANLGVMDQPNVHFFLGDGREFLLTTDRTYDLISSEPSNPYRAGIASLFTEEFYRTVEKKLKPGGIFVQWFQGYQTDANTVRIVLRTLRRALPFVEVWQSQASDFLFVASREKRVIDMAQLRVRVAREPYHSALIRGCWVEEAEGVLAQFVASDRLVASMVESDDGVVNSDDRNVLEFAFARNVEKKGSPAVDNLLAPSMARGAARPELRGVADWNRVDELRSRSWLVARTAPPRLPVMDVNALARLRLVTWACHPSGGKGPQSTGSVEPRDIVEVYAIALEASERGDPGAAQLADVLERAGLGPEAQLMRARLLVARGADQDALEAALTGLALLRERPLAICATDQKLLQLIDTIGQRSPTFAQKGAEALLVGPLAAGEQEELRRDTALRLAFIAGGQLCLRALEQRSRHLEWTDWALKGRYKCLKEHNHPLTKLAEAELAEFMRAQDSFFELKGQGFEP
jgi:spermidine synthase